LRSALWANNAALPAILTLSLSKGGDGRHGAATWFRPVRLDPAPLAGVAQWLGDYRRFWDESFERLDDYVQDLKRREGDMAATDTAEPVADLEVVITRIFDAPARLLFAAYSRPEHLMKWFGPAGWPLTQCEVDFRVGGRFRFAMTGPSGVQNTPFGGTYREIVPHRRIVFDNGFEAPGAQRMVMTVTFEETAGRTTLTLHTLFATAAMRAEHVGMGFVEGTSSAYDQLANIVAAMRKR